ncbi:flagellar export protein FliJ [Pseudomonas cannabina]|uniref:Flagellar FliJ protein n=4 Tax=Pseudomonas syringae group TaxID=136849 RepID=A0A3M3R1H2_PSECA|nr:MULTISPECIES: flagellar export protein FliJ [Pseudomonas syringae group]KPB68709.1 Flagellar biosynthesis chaperone [Pseudomonas syringae pv. maculicola]MBM0140822.1 flagella biosynthesis chaperone FliJ [Pseudomonas cannabina pv. alisalensis]QHE96443.1 flagella biosynthesis chaperone FliJ [Pseudomonas syringae pv. maculicola str. ES4326]QQN20499.1 flagella biosynthesis chaperone FliJ [Pseudomonas cannabina pv. alisalensis]RMN85910.1 Flagellar biosynthesis chaperone [Pseudomonas cannabina]
MAQSRAARLAPVVEMAEAAERTAAQRLGHFQGQVNLANSKLQELDQFRQDYQQQWLQRGSAGVSGQWLLGYQRFLSQLDVAVAQQYKSLEWHKTNLDRARTAWQDCYARVEGLRKLVQRYMDEARKLEDKREQKLLDELSQRLPRHEQF